MEEKFDKETVNKLVEYRDVTTLSQKQALTLFDLMWPEAQYEARLKGAIICHQYGLNPLMKHICLIKFDKYEYNKEKGKKEKVGEKWECVQEIGSNRIIAQRRHRYTYLDLSPRRMTEDEEIKINGEVDKSKIWAITLLKDLETGAECTGTGYYPAGGDEPYGHDKGNTRLNQAKIRSERNALDRLYPAELPQGVEVMEEAYIDAEYREVENVVGETPLSKPEGEAARDGRAQGGGETKHRTTRDAEPRGQDSPAAKVAAEPTPPDDELEGAGFHINLPWLNESLKALKWSDDTCKSYLVGKYKVSTQGSLQDVLKRLNREQAEEFVADLRNKLEKQPKFIF